MRKSAGSVFGVLAVNPKSVGELPVAAFAQLLNQKNLSPWAVKYLKKMQAECLARKTPTCPFYDFKNRIVGSAFLTEDREHLWTSWSVVEETFVAEEQKLDRSWGAKKKEVHLTKNPAAVQLAVFDSKGTLVFDSAAGDDKAALEFFPLEGRSENPILSASANFARIKLSKKLEGTGLAWSAGIPVPDDEVFLAGYPSKTTTREKKFNAPDAPGESLVVSRGKILSGEKALKKQNEKFEAKPEFFKTLDGALLFSDADADLGSSGGPWLNTKGEVVGIVSGLLNAKGNSGQYPVAVYGATKGFIKLYLDVSAAEKAK